MGTSYNLRLDGVDRLRGTQYTHLFQNNAVKPKKDKQGKKLVNAIKKFLKSKDTKAQRRRRLLNVNWEKEWDQFTPYVETIQGSCSASILTGVNVKPNGEFHFSCSQSSELCKC